jgi:hypothetical protein
VSHADLHRALRAETPVAAAVWDAHEAAHAPGQPCDHSPWNVAYRGDTRGDWAEEVRAAQHQRTRGAQLARARFDAWYGALLAHGREAQAGRPRCPRRAA